jgi:hypothetical protein
MKRRSNKKFLVKVWVPIQNKAIFRTHCMEYHLSMMFVGEKYLTKSLDKFSDEQISLLLEDRLVVYNKLNKGKELFEPLGIRVTNDYWQKLAWFAVTYHSTVAKVASVLFENAIGAYEFKEIFDEYGLEINRKKVANGVTIYDRDERLSDYY